MAKQKADDIGAELEQPYAPAEVLFERASQPDRIPLIPCKVVYLGGLRTKSVPLKGRVLFERIEQPDGTIAESKEAVIQSGFTAYDFSTHDRVGRLIRQRLMPDTAPAEVRGRPFCTVEHGYHLWQFSKMRETKDSPLEFRIVAPPDALRRLEEYFYIAERAFTRQQELTRQVFEGA